MRSPGEDIVKVGDKVKVEGRPEYGSGKIMRFYANQGTVLVNFDNDEMVYCKYGTLEKEDEKPECHEK